MTVLPLSWLKELTAYRLEVEAVISFYFLSLLLKCFSNNSANAISNVIIISNSANVTYIHITSPHCFEGRKRNVSLPSDRGKQPPPFWCPPGAYICAMNILPHFVENVNTFRRTYAAQMPHTRRPLGRLFFFEIRFFPKQQREKGHLQGGISRLFSLSEKKYSQSKFQSKSRCL